MRITTINNLSFCSAGFKQNNTKFREKVLKPKNLIAESLALGVIGVSGAVIIKKTTPDKMIKALAKDLSIELKKKIRPADLKSVMSIKEFEKYTKSLKKENYISSPENIKKGIFRADFHSHSMFSDGASSVEDILSQAAEYGNKLNKINGEKFLFALSDHDGVGGVKEALKLIAENPKKYKNIKFIPAAELSFPIISEPGSVKHNNFHNEIEMAELLIYGINPFSKNSENYFTNLYNKRKCAIESSLKYASENIANIKFSEEEYNSYFLRKKTPYCMLYQHWRIFQYVNLKMRITQIAKELNKNPEELYSKIMPELPRFGGFDGYALNKYLENNNINNNSKTYLDEAYNIMKEISPHYKGPLFINKADSSFDEIVTLANQENAQLAFAHPGFTLQNMTKSTMAENVRNYIEKSDGRLKYSESYHQAYPPNNITAGEIEETNKIMENAGLISIGGRDMHRDNFKFPV